MHDRHRPSKNYQNDCLIIQNLLMYDLKKMAITQTKVAITQTLTKKRISHNEMLKPINFKSDLNSFIFIQIIILVSKTLIYA